MREHGVLLPNPYRCLQGLRVSVASIIVLLALAVLERMLCTVGGSASWACRAVQAPYEWWLGIAALAGLGYTIYAAYRDFFKGRYYSDLAKVQRH